MKKISIALAALALSATAASANHTGFFVGLGAVTGATSAKTTATSPSVLFATQKTDAGKTMFGGRIEAGYGMTFAGSGYAAVSVYGTLNSGTINALGLYNTNGNVQEKLTLKNRGNYGVEVKLGYHLTKDTVGFIGIAAEATRWKLTWSEGNGAGASQAANTAVFQTFNTNKTKLYAKPVIGLRTMFTKNLYVEAKYGYGFSNKINMTIPASTQGFVTGGTPTAGARSISVRPRTHEFSVTVGWRF